MQTLYELTEGYLALSELIESGEYTEEELADTFESIDEVFEDKAQGYACVMRDFRAQEEAYDAEIRRLKEKKDAAKRAQERLKATLEHAMRATGKTKFKTSLFDFGIRKNPPSLVMDDPTKLPAAYLIPQPAKVDSAALKRDVKADPSRFEGIAHLEQGESLSIR